MVAVLLSLEHLPEHRRAGIGMFPEIVIADYPGNFNCYWIIRCKIAGNDSGAADRCVDMEQCNYPLNLFDLVIPPAVMIPPLYVPAVCLCLVCDRFSIPVIPEIRDREEVSFPLAGSNKREECRKFSYRTPDRKYAFVAVLHAVDGISSYGIKIIMGQVDNMCGAALYSI